MAPRECLGEVPIVVRDLRARRVGGEQYPRAS